MRHIIWTIIFLVVGNAQASNVIVSPNAVLANTFGEWSAELAVDNLRNQSGLSDSFVSGITNYDDYLALNPTNATGSGNVFGGAQNIFSGTIDFDLGAEFDLFSFVLWGDDGFSTQSIKNFNLYSASSADFSDAILVGSFLALNGQPAPIPDQVFGFSSVNTQYVRLEVLDAYSGVGTNINIAEVAFGASVVPIPAAVWLFGSALAGLGWSRRKQTT